MTKDNSTQTNPELIYVPIEEQTMEPQQEQHLANTKEDICRELDRKYRLGQIEHGGNLWNKTGIIDMIIEEVTDLVVYCKTLKDQIDNRTIYKVNGVDKDAK